jgi:hypothetical protein
LHEVIRLVEALAAALDRRGANRVATENVRRPRGRRHECDLRTVARSLGGEVSGDQVRAPGPDHSLRDQSLSVKPSAAARDGFVCHSFFRTCRDYVKSQLGLARFDGRGITRV